MVPDRYLSTAAAFAGSAVIVAGLLMSFGCWAEDAFEVVAFPATDGGSIEAALFAAEGDRAAVFAHGVSPLCVALLPREE